MTQTSWVVAAAGFGACIGSFLNVVIHRLPLEDPAARSLGGRSRCPHCGTQIAWRDNIPLLGWLLLRGKARCCGKPVAARYPLIEAFTAASFALLLCFPPHGPLFVDGQFVTGSFLALLLDAFFLSVLIASTVIDYDWKLLPDALTYPLMFVGVAGSWLVPGLAGGLVGDDDAVSLELRSVLASLFGLGVGAGATWSIRYFGSKVFRKEAMGLGDVKFLGGIGAFLGWQGTLLALFVGCVAGAVVGGLQLALSSRRAAAPAAAAADVESAQERRTIPFGPFLAVGAVVALFAAEPLLTFLFQTWPEWQARSAAAPWVMSVMVFLSILALVILVRRGRGNA